MTLFATNTDRGLDVFNQYSTHNESVNRWQDTCGKKGKSPEKLSSSIWWSGPIWLTKSNQQWPHREAVIDEGPPKESEAEIKGSKTLYEAKLVSGENPKLLRVAAWILQFVGKLKKRNTMPGPLTAQELQRAKLLWKLHIQQNH